MRSYLGVKELDLIKFLVDKLVVVVEVFCKLIFFCVFEDGVFLVFFLMIVFFFCFDVYWVVLWEGWLFDGVCVYLCE